LALFPDTYSYTKTVREPGRAEAKCPKSGTNSFQHKFVVEIYKYQNREISYRQTGLEINKIKIVSPQGHETVQLIDALCYKLGGHGFDS
jgi:hypothetical protein